MIKGVIIKILGSKSSFAYILSLIALFCWLSYCEFYNYVHIPINELNGHILKKTNTHLKHDVTKIACPIFTFTGKRSYTNQNVPTTFNDFQATDIKEGGEFVPPHCNPEISVAIIVTYRNRQSHLDIFLPYMHNFLRKQNIHYQIFVIEQIDERAFNKGLLYNVGAHLAIQSGYPCLILHDVDLLPLNEGNLYACLHSPRHLSGSIDKFRYVLPYTWLVGGVLAVSDEDYVKANGLSNKFLNWGGEDDDFYNRLHMEKLDILRFPPSLSEYTMLLHNLSAVNSQRQHMVVERQSHYKEDGYRQHRYARATTKRFRLFTQVAVETPIHT